MKHTLLFFSLIVCSVFCNGQQDTIKAANLIFERPNSKWFLKEIKDTNGWTIYSYKREPIIDSEGRYVIPNISFMVEKIPDTINIDVIKYSVYRRGLFPAKTIGMFTGEGENSGPKYENTLSSPKMQYKNTVGFIGVYKDGAGEHTVYLNFLLNKQNGVMVIMDMTSELFRKYQKEFNDGLWSIKGI